MLVNALVAFYLKKGGWSWGQVLVENSPEIAWHPSNQYFFISLICVLIDPYFLKNKIAKRISGLFFITVEVPVQLPYLCYCRLLCR